jgi:photosystem II stability/assembly factor-like uncharacterized protein
MSTSRTYTVGNNGGVRKLVDLTGPWLDVPVGNSLPAAATHALYDVETDPLDGDRVFVVGDGFDNTNTYGIYGSIDGGNTWYIPGGNYQFNDLAGRLTWHEVWVLDSNNIMVAGQNGYVAISNNGGLLFNLTTQLPLLPPVTGGKTVIPTVWSVHFITPTIGVVGLDAHVAKTIDGGLTWSILNGGNVIFELPNQLVNGRGIHMSADQQTIVVVGETAIFQSLDAGVTWNNVYTFQQRQGQHLTWINDLELWAFGNGEERVKSIDGGATWSILSSGGPGGPDEPAGHFYLNQNGFYNTDSTVLSTNNGALSGSVSEVSPYNVFAIWTWYLDTVCYTLTSCDDTAAPILVNNDLSLNIGDAILICPDDVPDPDFTECTCFIISTAARCIGSITLPTTNTYSDCITCTPVCYVLVDCTDVANFIVTSDDFLQYVGQIVKLSECPDTCWLVSESLTCQNSVCVSEVIEVFATCVACLPPVIPPPPLELHPRRVKPGYYTPGCSPEYTENVNCNFGDQMYNQMLIDRYGLTICCEESRIKWSIKKELLDLKAIYDPALCKCYLQDCCPPACVEATLQVFNPTLCLAPQNVTAELDF